MKEFFKKIVIKILTIESKAILFKYKPKIIAITGSVGKTSTKDAIFSVLKNHFYVRKSQKSFNSDIGVPLTILGVPNGYNNPIRWMKNILEGLALIFFKNHYPKILIVEVGADTPGDILNIAKWLRPDTVVITRFPEVPVHVEFFPSSSAVIDEKKNLLRFLKPYGFVILNGDDEKVLDLKKEFKFKSLTYGLEKGNDVKGGNRQFFYKDEDKDGVCVVDGVNFKIDVDGKSVPINLKGVLGEGHIYAVLSAIAVGVSEGLNIIDIVDAINIGYDPQPGRMKIIEGIKGSTIIDDTYNSSPIALQKAIETLRDITCYKRKIAILGDMMELGRYTKEEHEKAGEFVGSFVDLLLCVGPRSKFIIDGAMNKGMSEKSILHFEDSRKAGLYLQNLLKEGDLVLAKGSRWATRMERAVEEIMAEPLKKKDLLVGQEEEYRDK